MSPRIASQPAKTSKKRRSPPRKVGLNGRDPLIPTDPDDDDGEIEEEPEEEDSDDESLGAAALDEEDLSELDEEELGAIAERTPLVAPPEEGKLDLFDMVELKYHKRGMPVTYQIKRNGQILTSREHPYSLDKIQEEYKGGVFVVVAKRTDNGRIIAQQTYSIANVEEVKRNPTKTDLEETERRETAPVFGTAELMAVLAKKEQDAKADAREEARRSESTNMQMMTLITTMMQSSQALMTSMMQKGNEMMMAMTERMDRAAQESAREFRQQLLLMETKKEKGLDPLALIALLKESEKSGFSQMVQLSKMAKEEARERSELLEGIRERNSDKDEKSMTDKLIESVLPAIVSGTEALKRPAATAPTPASSRTLAAPRVNAPARQAAPVVPIHRPTVPVQGTSSPSVPSQETLMKDLKAKIEALLLPEVGSGLTGRKDAKAVALHSRGLLKSNGIDLTGEQLAGVYPLTELLQTAYQNGVPRSGPIAKMADVWLKSFYGHFTHSTPAVQASASPDRGVQPGGSSDNHGSRSLSTPAGSSGQLTNGSSDASGGPASGERSASS